MEVLVYSRTVCPQCILLKFQLNQEGIEYQEVNIDDDAQAENELKEANISSVPVAKIEGKFVRGIEEIVRVVK